MSAEIPPMPSYTLHDNGNYEFVSKKDARLVWEWGNYFRERVVALENELAELKQREAERLDDARSDALDNDRD